MRLNDFTTISFYFLNGIVYCNLRFKGQTKQFSTKIRISKDEFYDGWIHPSSRQGREAKQNLEDLLERAKNLRIKDKYTIGTVVNLISGQEKENAFEYTLLGGLRYAMSVSKGVWARSTYEQYDLTLNSFINYLAMEDYEDVSPSGISPSLTKGYRDYLLNYIGNSPSTASNKITRLSALYTTFMEDREDEFDIPPNPFIAAKSSMKRILRDEPSKKQERIQDYALTEEQVKTIQEYPLDEKYERYRDMVIWQILTGFSFDDLLHYNWTVKESDGERFIVLNRGKTKKIATIPMLDITCDLYDRLKETYGDKVFPVDEDLGRDVYYHRYFYFLIKLSRMTGIHLRSHLFRHTFGMLMSKAGIPMSDIADMLGHSSVSTTEGYYVSPKSEDLVKRSNLQLKKGLISLT